MRRFALAVLVVVATPLLMAAGQAPPAFHHVELSDADKTELDAISASLNAITTLKGSFLQIEPSGTVDEGQFYIEKPGKMRFDYKPPVQTLLVSDGHTVAVANRRLKTVDHYALADTPLKLILSNTIDIRHDPSLVSIEREQGTIVLSLRTSQNRSKANIALVFTEPDYELRQWTVIDEQGLATTVALRDLQPGAALEPALFVLPDKNALARPRAN